MLTDISTGTEQLILTGEVAASPESLFRHWVEPDLLAQWWAQEAEIDPRVGGEYVLSWPRMGWNLRGRYTRFEPGKQLGFTWNWDHEPNLPERVVDVRFEPAAGGTRLAITHGPYSDTPEDQQDRQSHLDGWQHFVQRLAEVVSA